MTKELILCALKKNVSKLHLGMYISDICYETVFLNTSETTIYISKSPIKERIVLDTFFNKLPFIPSEIKETKRVTVGFRYYVKAFGKEYDITQAEYDNIYDSYSKYQKNMKLKHISNLCHQI